MDTLYGVEWDSHDQMITYTKACSLLGIFGGLILRTQGFWLRFAEYL